MASINSNRTFRIALVQLLVGCNKLENIRNAVKSIKIAAQQGANIVTLPEMFNCPYGVKYFPEYGEEIPVGETCVALANAAKENGVYLVAGSIPEKDGNQLFNTCPIFDNKGNFVAKHRKMHLFDIDIPGKITFKESTNLSPGNNFTIVNTRICYDIRFPELAMIYQNMGCKLLVYPGAFNLTTGPAHWSLLLKSRAVDNQVFVAGVSPARNENAEYKAWGHSSLFDPFGDVLVEGDHNETILYADIDLEKLTEIRKNIPYLSQKRSDLYEIRNLT